MKQTRQSKSPRWQRGATAVEFAILFPLFFLILYAIVTYGMIFAVQQSLTLAATEGARAALNYLPPASTTEAISDLIEARAQAACTTAQGLLGWLSSATLPLCTNAPCSYNNAMYCVQVKLTYPLSNPLVPTIGLFNFILPSKLTGQAMVQINPENVI